MPVPSSIDDLSTTASSNSPAGSESPTDGDNYIRTYGSFIATLRDKLDGDTVPTLKNPQITGTTMTVAPSAVTWSGNPTHSGNHTFSGTTTLAAVTGVTDLTTTGNTTLGNATADTLNVGNGGLVKDSVGRVYGNALHNNASGVSGSTQYIASGTYTPTYSNGQNINSPSGSAAQYIRVGSVITVSGQASIDPVTASTTTILGITLPIASSFSATSDCCGTGVSQTGSLFGSIYAETTGDIAWLVFEPASDVASRTWSYHFTYLVR